MNEWISAAFGLLGVIVGAGLTYVREYLVQRKKQKQDVAYLAVVVSGALERFSAGCLRVVNDDGLYQGQPNREGSREIQARTPEFRPELLNVEWKSLPTSLMYEILDLPYRIEVANGVISDAAEYAAMPPDYEEFYEQRQYQYADLGIAAARLAARLRAQAGFSERRRGEWDPVAHMEAERAKIEKFWHERAGRHTPQLDV
ncbi:hypothetical protein LDO26_00045 [Luteimonas sp. BDR2-5]|uniref:hypothetical protein n=1 Tax=Proluteimonas luteida TaxID=2878685 RepID=UPI001E4F236D|nr:hypothetical protein [Luteimonas sp. BDR2-5]MCD9026605.1 hypothetical protein [Luteimonas sp. BDR2-5]